MRRSLLVFALVVGLTSAGAASAAAPPRLTDAAGLHVTASAQLDDRLLAVSATTTALNGPTELRVLLPTGYAAHPGRRYPVLYLLHGTSGGAADWTGSGDAAAATAGRPVIVVMPDIALNRGGGGWCTDWVNGGAFGAPKWETFHIGQLIPWVDRNLRTLPTRNGRAIAGLSQGGFCAMSYAARHPDRFLTAVSFSGAPDISYDAIARESSTPIVNVTETVLDHVPAGSAFGPRETNEINWAAHDPATLAINLRHTTMRLYTGDGQPGPLDPAGAEGRDPIETLVRASTELFHARLGTLGIPSFYDDYGPGTHRWAYWARDLRQAIDPVMATFARPPAAPTRVTFTSADATFGVFGWRVATRRPAREFSTLRDASRRGFTLQGSGSARVTTPKAYPRGAALCVAVARKGARTAVSAATSRDGRLRITVPLGPGNAHQQFTPDAAPLPTKVFTTRVAITTRPRAGCGS